MEALISQHLLQICGMALFGAFTFGFGSCSASAYESDSFTTPSGKKLAVTFIKHGSLAFDYDGFIIYIDPVSELDGKHFDFKKMPKADAIVITHDHFDHFDPQAVALLSKNGTRIITNESTFAKLHRGTVMHNGDSATIAPGIALAAVPAYNYTEGHTQFHPRGRDNGFVIDFGGMKVLVAADTEDIPEMEALHGIDIAFLPVNQPYTMTVAQCVKAAMTIKPKILYPYHYGDTKVEEIAPALAGTGIDVRIRQLQ